MKSTEFIRENSDNNQYLEFSNMVGQHFDVVWLYTKEISEKLNHLETIMENVSCPLLNGHSLLVESKVLMPGERYLDNKDKKFWRFISCELGLANEN